MTECGQNGLTLSIQGYSGSIKSISWLLMPCRRQAISSHEIDFEHDEEFEL